MGAPVGNQNATKNRPWRAALDRAIAQGDPEKLRRIAEKLLDRAEEGDIQAIKEVGDRLDGKPTQTVEGEMTLKGLTQVLAEMDEPESKGS